MARILIPLPDSDFDVTEVSVPWRLLTDNGHKVMFSTEKGGVKPAADPLLLAGVIFGALGAEDEAKTFYGQMCEADEFNAPVPWTELRAEDFDALLLPGGHAPGMRQYLGSATLHQRIAEFWATGRPVGAICHGVIALARAKTPDGRSVLHGVQTTCLPRYMERLAFYLTFWKLGRYYRTYPAYVEAEVREALASAGDFIRGPVTLGKRGTRENHDAAFVVQDGRYVSARWPGDAYLFAERFMACLASVDIQESGADDDHGSGNR
jgi:putative intracellular protease/amidase